MTDEAGGAKPSGNGGGKVLGWAMIGVVALLAMPAMCSSEPVPAEPAENAIAAPLDEKGQQARLDACMDRLVHYRDLGAWKAGGVRPQIERDAWNQLTDAEQAEIFDVAACIDAAGQIGERIVTVDSEFGVQMETKRVANDRPF